VDDEGGGGKVLEGCEKANERGDSRKSDESDERWNDDGRDFEMKSKVEQNRQRNRYKKEVTENVGLLLFGNRTSS
jgi:hypothetical protein